MVSNLFGIQLVIMINFFFQFDFEEEEFCDVV